MSVFPASQDYTDRDFASLRRRLQSNAQAAFPDWTDFNVASFGNILLEQFAFVGDVLAYYLDALARETRVMTATQRSSIIALTKLIGYRLPGARAATAEVVFRLDAPPAADVTLPEGTTIRTQDVTDPVRYRLLAPVTIPTGADPPTATGTVEHAELHDELFDATGLAHQELRLTYIPFLDDSAVVTASNGSYAVVDSLLDAGPQDRQVTVVVDQNDRAMLRFGDGLQGTVPTGTIQVQYKTGGGPRGNVDADRLVVLEATVQDAFGRVVKVTATNPQPASGGVPRQSLAEAKVRAPASLRTLNRSVTRSDFENNALRLPSVARALMLTSNEDQTIDENSGVLYVVPHGGGLPSQAVKDQVLHQVTVVYPCTLTFVVSVQDPVYRSLDVFARVYLRAGTKPTVVRRRIEQALSDYFAISLPDGRPNPHIGFGLQMPAQEVPWSSVLAVVASVPGVRKIGDDDDTDFLLNGVSDDVVLEAREFPVLGAVTVVDGNTEAVLV